MQYYLHVVLPGIFSILCNYNINTRDAKYTVAYPMNLKENLSLKSSSLHEQGSSVNVVFANTKFK